MEDKFNTHVLNWYSQFVHDRSESDDHTSPNFFTRIDENDVIKFEKEFGNILPDSYLKFLRIIGDGRLREDITGRFSEFHENVFLNTLEIAEILRRDSDEWDIYPDFITDNEIPFFSLGNNAVLVFRKNEGSATYFPHLDEKYSDNFEEFITKLMNNCTFHIEN